MKKVIYLLVLTFALASCVSQSEHDKVVKEYNKVLKEKEQLSKELSQAKKDLEGYKMSPKKLCANIEQLLKDKNVSKLKEIEGKLSKYYPESAELKKVKQYRAQAEKQIEQEKAAAEKKRLQAVNKLKKKHDDVSGITWYYNPYFTHYNDANLTSIYMGKEGTNIWLILKMSYTGDDWIFFENAYLSYDGNTREVSFNKYNDKESDNSGGEVWEWIQIGVDDYLLSLLREMVNGKSVKMRLSGKYTKTRNLSVNEIQGIKDVLLAYDVLKEEAKKKQ